MSKAINLIAFGTFGNPYGFRQTFFVGDNEFPKKIKSFDLNTVAIKLFPQSTLYCIRKELVNNRRIISYSVYDFAKEPNSTRGGTFIGSSILFIDKIAEENITINCLTEFHTDLKKKNVKNDVISVTHSDNFSVSRPKDFDIIDFHLKEIDDNLDFFQTANKQLVIYCDTNPDNLQEYFKRSVDLLNIYDNIYFTENKEVAEFVHQKNIFKLIQKEGFEREIQELYEERMKRRLSAASSFEKEIQRLNDDKRLTIETFKERISENLKVHKENEIKIEESKMDVEKVEQIYNDFSSKIMELANQLKSGTNLLVVKEIYIENKNRFVDGITQLRRPQLINKIPKAKPNSGFNSEIQNKVYEGFPQINGLRKKKGKHTINIDKVTTAVLLLLLIGTWLYFIFFNTQQEPISTKVKQEMKIVQPDSVSEKPTAIPVQDLNPKPNSQLNENDYRLVMKNLRPGATAEDVVKIIFEINPTDIKKHYTGQETIYTKQIIELNKNCFEEKSGVNYYTKDTIRIIPSYKKGNE